MPRAMFDYTKEILKRVSFDVHLFSKEIEKAVKFLLPHEIDELRLFVHQLIEVNPSLQTSLIYLPSR